MQSSQQFVNAVLEEDGNKLDKVAVIRLCGPYSQGTPPFSKILPGLFTLFIRMISWWRLNDNSFVADFPPRLRRLVEGHHAFMDGGYQGPIPYDSLIRCLTDVLTSCSSEVDGSLIAPLDRSQLESEAASIKSRSITSIVLVGIYSPSNPSQEGEAAAILSAYLGPGYDITCSHKVGRLGFLERENASIINASLRRFARHVIAGFVAAMQTLGLECRLYITLNDGTLSRASEAAEYPVRCFSSGPTNSARGAAVLATDCFDQAQQENREVLVVDVGG